MMEKKSNTNETKNSKYLSEKRCLLAVPISIDR